MELIVFALESALSLYMELPKSKKSSSSSSSEPPTHEADFLNDKSSVDYKTYFLSEPVMRTNWSISGMADNNSWVILNLVLPPVLIPSIVDSKSITVFSEAFIFPVDMINKT